MTRGRWPLAAAGVTLIIGVWRLGDVRPSFDVPMGISVSDAVRKAPEGAVLRLQPGVHAPFEVTRRVTVEAAPGAIVRGPVTVRADGAELVGLRVRGGESGIAVLAADGVRIRQADIRGAELHGIEVVAGSARIDDCTIGRFTTRYGQGIEVRNANGTGRTVVEGCTITAGQEGLVSHVSRVEFLRNRVTGTTLRAIVITEMSEGLAEGNTVERVSGAALYCGDMSHCEIRGNDVREVGPARGAGRSHAGHGAVAWYYSMMRISANSFDGLDGQQTFLSIGSTTTDRFPLGIWPAGWSGLLPGLVVVGISVLTVVAVRAMVFPWVRRVKGRAPALPIAGSVPAEALWILLGGFAVQSFHMLEHVVQVFQVYVADAEVRNGLLGALVDTEWVHFGYNVAALAFIVWAWTLVRPDRGPLVARAGAGAPFLLAALFIQTYHVGEHVAKVVQHLQTGIDPAPGLIGGQLGLVWFHFGINLSVYLGMAAPLVAAFLSLLRDHRGPIPTRGHASSTPILVSRA